jgi:uncharacterized protein YndB with AHSA1/START domain
MPDIIHRLGFRRPAAQVHEAIASLEGLAHWWTDEVGGDGRVGGRIAFTFRSRTGVEIGAMTMEVTELAAPTLVRWRCVAGPPEWLGTAITFELSTQDDLTILVFGHRGWREAGEFMAHCSMKWAVFLLSLRDHVESGKGRPSPHDLKIDNWN